MVAFSCAHSCDAFATFVDHLSRTRRLWFATELVTNCPFHSQMSSSLPTVRRVHAWLALIAFVLGGCSKRASAPASPPTVTVLQLATRGFADEISASGAIEAIDQTQLGFMVGGRLKSIEVEDGASVEAGQLLARLDDTDYRHELAIAEAKLAETQSREERLRQMHDLGSLTATDFEKITAALTETRSAADLARRRVGYSELHAPFAGRVTRHPVSVGTVVAPGVPICSVLAPAPVWAVLSVPEVDAVRIQTGQTVHVRLAAMERVEAVSTVESVLPQADPMTRSFNVKIRLPNSDLSFRPGNVVTATIAVGPDGSVLTINPAAVQHFPDGALYVWVADREKRSVTRRIVSVGRARDTEVEVTAGLHAGEWIVTGSAAPLFDGMQVAFSTP